MRELIDLLSAVFSPTRPETTAADGNNPAPSAPPPPSAAAAARGGGGAATVQPPRSSLNPTPSVLAGAASAAPFVMPGMTPGVESPSELARLAAASLADAASASGGGGGGGSRAGETVPRGPASAVRGGDGFWRCWPLFRVYEPDPTAVVPRGGAGWEDAVAASVSKAKAKENSESRLRVN